MIFNIFEWLYDHNILPRPSDNDFITYMFNAGVIIGVVVTIFFLLMFLFHHLSWN